MLNEGGNLARDRRQPGAVGSAQHDGIAKAAVRPHVGIGADIEIGVARLQGGQPVGNAPFWAR